MNKKATEEQVIEYLRELDPGRYPLELFKEFARLNVLASVEVIPLRWHEGKVQVLLMKRPKGDVWEDQWHAPGTMMLPTDSIAYDHDFADPFGRVLGKNGELDEIITIGEPVLVGSERRKSLRGDEFSSIYYVEVSGGEPKDGTFVYVDENFPPTDESFVIIDYHINMIIKATREFVKLKELHRSFI